VYNKGMSIEGRGVTIGYFLELKEAPQAKKPPKTRGQVIDELVGLGYACRNDEFTPGERNQRANLLLDQTTPEVCDWLRQTVDGRKPIVTRVMFLLSGDKARIEEALAEKRSPESVETQIGTKPSASLIQYRVQELADKRKRVKERERRKKKKRTERGRIPLRSSYNK